MIRRRRNYSCPADFRSPPARSRFSATTTSEVETGEAGEICVRAPHVMSEYWKRPEQNAETLKNGWLHTGDIARADERGYLFILDRKKDMIVSGGFNIFPREVEDVLSQHADVAMVAVVGVPDDKWGEAVTAVVVPREGTRPSAEELIASCQSAQGFGACAQACEVRQRASDDRRRQGRQEGAEGRLLGRTRADGGIAALRRRGMWARRNLYAAGS